MSTTDVCYKPRWHAQWSTVSLCNSFSRLELWKTEGLTDSIDKDMIVLSTAQLDSGLSNPLKHTDLQAAVIKTNKPRP